MNLVNYNKDMLIILMEDYIKRCGRISFDDYLKESGIVDDFLSLRPGDIVSSQDGSIYTFTRLDEVCNFIVCYGTKAGCTEEEILPPTLFRKKCLPEITVSVTGHRPNKLGWGYDYDTVNWQKLRSVFKEKLIHLLAQYSVVNCWTGMALGVDTVFALAVLELKDEGHPLNLCCAVPCKGQEKKWPKESQKLYHDILSKADAVKCISEAYTSRCMNERNEFMVDRADEVIAVWDGSNGGTGNSVAYAMKNNKTIELIKPDFIQEKKAE